MFGDQFLTITDSHATKLAAGKYKYPVIIHKKNDRLWFQFGYNKPLMEEIKTMAGAKFHGYEEPPIKQWSVFDNTRNRFRIAFMEGRNPYANYDKPLVTTLPTRKVYAHQTNLFQHGLTYHYCVWAASMGVGKTLAAIELIEASGVTHCFYVAPKSALNSVRLEFEKWGCKVRPVFLTYEGLRSVVEKWTVGEKPPQLVIFDEASKLKNPTTKRTQAAQHLADAIREEWGWAGYVILMSGTPAPRQPIDWWSLCEIAMPGFLKEGTLEKFRKRLAIMSQGQNDAGQVFAKLVAWKDDPKRCDTCGKFADDNDHDTINAAEKWFHAYTPSVNEVSGLFSRMAGLVNVKDKRQVLKELPELQFKVVQCKPDQTTLTAAKMIAARGESTIKTLTLLRELSDGFQYQDTDIGTETCPLCQGAKIVEDWAYVGPDDQYDKIVEDQFHGRDIPPGYFEKINAACNYCGGSGETTKYHREAVQVPCPKEDALLDIIDTHDDIGRLVCFAGFTGSVDRCVNIFLRMKWEIIRVDGRGWMSPIAADNISLQKKFLYDLEGHPRLAFIGQPGAGGMGLNLQSSPTVVFYSNDFNGESRLQAENRIHRPGMSVSRGATVIDLFNLPTDAKVLENLRLKKRLQDMTMGTLREALEQPIITTYGRLE
jgi:hypothetical protein